MFPFVLVDLTSQVELIPFEVRRPPESFLAWLKLYGEREPFEVRYGVGGKTEQWYRFYSWWGPQTTFRLTPEGTLLLFLGDHALVSAWSTPGADIDFARAVSYGKSTSMM